MRKRIYTYQQEQRIVTNVHEVLISEEFMQILRDHSYPKRPLVEVLSEVFQSKEFFLLLCKRVPDLTNDTQMIKSIMSQLRMDFLFNPEKVKVLETYYIVRMVPIDTLPTSRNNVKVHSWTDYFFPNDGTEFPYEELPNFLYYLYISFM